MASRRHVVPPAVLRTHGARPIFGICPSSAKIGSSSSSRRRGSGRNETQAASINATGNGAPGSGTSDLDGRTCVGVTVGNVDVVTSRGASIGTEAEMDDLTDFLERTANENENDDGRRRSADSSDSSKRRMGRGRRRRLVPPEIVFPGAYVSVRFRGPPAAAAAEREDPAGSEGGSAPTITTAVTFDARSALGEWAEAHGPLPPPPPPSDADGPSSSSSSSLGVDGPGGCRGVSILRSVDARLWSERMGRGGGSGAPPQAAAAAVSPSGAAAKAKAAAAAAAASPGAIKAKKRLSGGGGGGGGRGGSAAGPEQRSSFPSDASASSATSAASAASNTEFRYDWTYSTPYGGTVARTSAGSAGAAASSPSSTATLKEGTNESFNGRSRWKPAPESGIDLTLLSDRTQPILCYDDVDLYEDDLHDNGASLLNVKVRVMPRCLFVLCRLFVRVDYVAVRVRDVRIYHRFGTDEVWRDVAWRECPWDGLGKAGLPDDVGRWRLEDGGAADNKNASVQALMGRIPEVPLPEDLTEHSVLDLGGAGAGALELDTAAAEGEAKSTE